MPERTPLAAIGLSSRTCQLLTVGGIQSVEELKEKSASELLDVPGFKLRNILDVKARLTIFERKQRSLAKFESGNVKPSPDAEIASRAAPSRTRPSGSGVVDEKQSTACNYVRQLEVMPPVIRSLEASGLRLIRDLVELTRDDLKRLPGVGAFAVGEIEKALEPLGLHLKADSDSGSGQSDSSGERSVWGSFDPIRASVGRLVLDRRTRNCLREAKILYLGQLVEQSEADLLGLRGFGRNCLAEVKRELDLVGLSLASSSADSTRLESPVDLADKNRPPIEDLFLSARPANSLERAGISYVDQLVSQTAEDVLSLPSVGSNSLREIQEKLAGFGLSLRVGRRPPHSLIEIRRALETAGPAENEANWLDRFQFGRRVENSLLEMGVDNIEKLLGYTVDDLMEFPRLGFGSVEKIQERLSRRGLALRKEAALREEFEREEFATVDEEFLWIAKNALPEHSREVVVARLGWNGGKPPTLAELAENPELAGLDRVVTRERIRQLETKGLSVLAKRLPGLRPVRILESLDCIRVRCPLPESEVGEILRLEGLSRVSFSFATLKRFSNLAEIVWPVERTSLGALGHYLDAQNELEQHRDLVDTILKASQVNSFVSVSDVAKAGGGEAVATAATVTALVDLLRELAWLDDSKRTFWKVAKGDRSRSNKVLFQCRKLFSVKRSGTLDELSQALERARTIKQQPSREVLAEMLRQSELFEVRGRAIEVKPGFEFDELNQTDRRLFQAARGLGRTVRFKTIVEALVREGMTTSNAHVNVIAYSPFLIPVSRGVYRLWTDPDHVDKRVLADESPGLEASDAEISERGESLSVVLPMSKRFVVTGKHRFQGIDFEDRNWTAIDSSGKELGRCTTRGEYMLQAKSLAKTLAKSRAESYELTFDSERGHVIVLESPHG